jgi:hypothetical protein
MLGRKDYTHDELDHARTAVHQKLAAYDALVDAVEGTPPALEAFEPTYCNDLVLVLDRMFVHRIRPVAGKDTNPLNEVELLADALISNGGVMRTNKVIKYVPDQSVLGLEAGDRIALSRQQVERLATAFLAEIETRFQPEG